ncbi:MAG: ATP-binding protein [Thermoplasmata archaeon]|nr:ATP-binding protein [Thermoplasmata archaeon]
MGKTRLIREAFPDSIYLFVSEEKSEKILASEWNESIGDTIYLPKMEELSKILEYLLKKEDRVVFIDEVQNLERINPAILSRLQHVIDENKDRARLVLCGSYVSLMNHLLTSSRSPLFGRMDMVLKLKELDIGTVMEITGDEGYGFEESIILYSIFGGMPRYYELLERMEKKQIAESVRLLFFEDMSPLRYEGSLVLRNEFGGEFRPYFSIMDSISMGKCSLSEISDMTGMKSQTLSKYIARLKDDFDLIKRAVPVTEDPLRSKKGRYFIKNDFYRFWFRYIHKNMAGMEEGREEEVWKAVAPSLPEHTGKTFEALIRNTLRTEDVRIGPWWNRRGEEIDIVGLDEKKNEILFGEVKWRNRPVDWAVVESLKSKAPLVQWRNEERKERYLVVSPSGFTPQCLEKMDAEGVMHWDLQDVERELG